MRNLKRALSLALASVMVLGLMIVGSSAKTSQFADATDINEDYKEAIDVLTTIGILEGVDDGTNYDPQGTLTREMAAKLISVMLLGKDNADRLGNNTQIFKDVAANRWSAGYIAYCYNAGIIAGDGAGNFDPEGKLTGVAFGKVLLTGLGYKSEIEGYVNTPSWSINVASDMIEAGVDVEGLTLSDPITREQAAQMVLNTIKAPLVEYEGRTQVNVNGAEIIVGGNEAKPVTTTIARENRISRKTLTSIDKNHESGYLVEFGEKYMTDLSLNELETDEFYTPSHVWTWKNEEIDTYPTTELMVAEYTTGVTGRQVFDLLGKTLLDDAEDDGLLQAYLDGKTNTNITRNLLVRTNNDTLPGTGNGVLTQIFLNTDYNYKNLTEIKIVSRNTWLAKANTSYNETNENAPLGVYTTYSTTPKTYKVDVQTVPEVTGVVKDEYYLVNISYKNDTANGEVVAISDPQILENSVVSKFSRSDSKAIDRLTAEGTQYYGAAKAFYDKETLDQYDESLLTDKTYNVFLDPYNYCIGVSLYEGTKNYVFITGFDRNRSNLSIKNADAAGIFLDGTMKTITVNVTDTENNIDKVMSKTNTNGTENAQYSPYYQKWNNVKLSDGTDLNGNPTLNRWYSYTVDEAGIYTLKPVKMNARLYTSDTTINTANVQVLASVPGIDDNNRSYGEDNSVYITVELDKVDTTDNKKAITEVNDVFTGVQNVDLDISQNLVAGAEAQVYTCFDNNNYIIGAIVIGDATGSVANYAYILGSIKSEEKIGDTYYWEFDAVLNGEQQTLTLKSKYASYADDIVKGRMVELRFDSDGYVVRVDDPDPVYNYSVATNDNGKDTDEYNVYWITSASAKKVFDLFLQGRTLYLTEKHSDRGLASASGAKAIVIQVENNKKVTTTWDSIEEAYAHLNDLSDSAEGVQFDGTIGAALNANGSAAWIVFDATVANRSQSVTQPTTPAGGYTPASIDPATGELKLRYYKTPMQPVQIKSEIEKLLGAVDHIDYVNGYVYLANGDVYKYNPAQTEVFAVRLNGNESPLAYVDSGGTWTVAGLPQGNYNVDASWHSSSYGYDISVASNGNITGQKGKTISSVNKDVNIFSAYKITFSSDVSGKITIYGTTTSKDLESGNYYYISATCPMDLSADGTDKYMKFTETTAGNDPEDINNEKFIKTGEKLTYKYEASHDATINVVSGYLVKVDGKQVGVFAGDIVFGDNSAYNDNSIFASVNKAVEKSNGNVFPSDAKITTTNSIGGFKIASATASSLAKDGVIDIVQVVEINATSITVSYSEDIEVDGTTNKYVKVGTELNLKETSPGGTKNLLQVKYDGIGTETNLDGQAGASKVTVGSGTSAAGASAVYKVPADYGKIAFSLKDSEA